MTEILHHSAALEVRRVPAGDGARIVVTFDSYHEPPGLDRPGFGEAFFRSEGITAIHVLSRDNDWFQHSEMEEVLRAIRTACTGAERILAYGSSMGGYGALRFGGRIGAHAVLALSPQFSLDPRRAPFETRWPADQRRIRFRGDSDQTVPAGPRMILAYDPTIAADRRHAELYAAAASVELLPLPRAGHPVGGFLNDIKLLRPLVLNAMEGNVDVAALLRETHARRPDSAHWLANLAEAQPPWRSACAVTLARRAAEGAPDHPSLRDALARRLAAAGAYAEAIKVHEQAIAAEPIPDYLWSLSKTQYAAGDPEAALRTADRLRALSPATAGYHAWASRLRLERGDFDGAIDDVAEALRHDPANRGYRWQLWRLRIVRLRRALFGY
jgi:hypothetical protein